MRVRLLLFILCVTLIIPFFALDLNAYTAAEVDAGEKEVGIFLTVHMGLNNAAACGVMANMYYESKFLPYADYKGISYGLCQWTGSRRAELFDWCANNGYNVTTIAGQMAYLEYELVNIYPSILKYLKSVPDTAQGAYDAGHYWCTYFERPADLVEIPKSRGVLARDTFYPKRHICDFSQLVKTEKKHPHAPTYMCPGCGRTKTYDDEWYYDDNCEICTQTPFHDVRDTAWYFDAVKFAYEQGIFNGINPTHFAPNVKMTRAMVVTTLYRMDNCPIVFPAEPFTDVDDTAYYFDAVLWAVEKGIVKGTSPTTFSPSALITREQLVTIICRYAEYIGEKTETSSDTAGYPDSKKVSGYAKSAFAWAVDKSLIAGTKAPDGKVYLDPQGAATRAQVATVLMRFHRMFIEK